MLHSSGIISYSEILLVPDITAQDRLWNTEYTISVTTQYIENGTLCTDISRHRLVDILVVAE